MREGDTVNVFDRAVAAVAPVHAAKPGPGWYCLKLDISKYFYRVNHEKLLAILERRVKDPAMMAFIRGVVNSRAEPFGLPRWRTPQDTPPEEWLYEVGMPIGNLTSQLFANIYLIKAAGYATDPGYPQKLIGLIEKYGLTAYDGKAGTEDKTSMNISITKKTSTHNTVAAAGRAIQYIVVHYTAGVTSKPGSAAGTASYFGSTHNTVSADFVVDDGGAVQYNGDIRNRYTWHCGGGKYNTKGGAYYGKATKAKTPEEIAAYNKKLADERKARKAAQQAAAAPTPAQPAAECEQISMF